MTGPVRTLGDGRVGTAGTGQVLAVCTGRAARLDLGDRVVTTGIDKRPVDGDTAEVGALGLEGDTVADPRHGGPDQALYAYGEADAAYWQQALAQDLPAGAFGENLRISGIDPSRALVGERWSVGAEVVVEATGPRIPCQVFAVARGIDDLVPRFLAADRPGSYLRVVSVGRIRVGDPVRVIARPDHGITIAEVSRIRTRADDEAWRLAELDGLGARTRDWVRQRLTMEGHV